MTILSDAVEFARSTSYRDLPQAVVEVAKRAILDYVGCCLAGCNQPVSRKVQNYARWLTNRSDCQTIGTGARTSANLAALSNGVSGHAMDFDDVSWSTIGHPTVSVAPAAIAAAEERHASGVEAIRAYVLGVEVQHKIAELVMPTVSERGWHTTSVFGCIGAAAAAAVIYDLAPEPFVCALGLSASHSSGIRANFGTATKPYHAGMSACNGVTSAKLAELGLTSSPTAIEGNDGFAQVFSGKKLDGAGKRFGSPWDLVTPGLVFKRYPCCSGAHPALDAIFELLAEERFSAEEVASIHVGVSLLGPQELCVHTPRLAVEGKFSMEYALSAAIVYGAVGLQQFTDSAVQDSRIQALIPKIKMEVDPELAALGFIGTAPAKIELHLANGRVLRRHCDLAKGNPEKLLTDADLHAKFLNCASLTYSPERAQAALQALLCLEAAPDICAVTQALGAVQTDEVPRPVFAG